MFFALRFEEEILRVKRRVIGNEIFAEISFTAKIVFATKIEPIRGDFVRAESNFTGKTNDEGAGVLWDFRVFSDCAFPSSGNFGVRGIFR